MIGGAVSGTRTAVDGKWTASIDVSQQSSIQLAKFRIICRCTNVTSLWLKSTNLQLRSVHLAQRRGNTTKFELASCRPSAHIPLDASYEFMHAHPNRSSVFRITFSEFW
jgi:hypothetical protein